MTADVNVVVFPDGRRLVRNQDDATAKAEALRLGLFPGMVAELGKRSGQRGVAGLARDGDRIVAVIVWAGFAAASDNGWGTLSISPATEETAGWLSAVAHRIVGADTIRIEGDGPWHN